MSKSGEMKIDRDSYCKHERQKDKLKENMKYRTDRIISFRNNHLRSMIQMLGQKCFYFSKTADILLLQENCFFWELIQHK